MLSPGHSGRRAGGPVVADQLRSLAARTEVIFYQGNVRTVIALVCPYVKFGTPTREQRDADALRKAFRLHETHGHG